MGLVDSFLAADLLVQVSAIVVVVAQIFNWMAFCTSSWWVSSGTHTGLWRSCGQDFIATCSVMDGTGSAASWLIAVCVFGAYADRQKGSDPGKLGFSFGLAIVALILSLAAGVMVLVSCCKGGSVGSK